MGTLLGFMTTPEELRPLRRQPNDHNFGSLSMVNLRRISGVGPCERIE
jgi:hypothetical protein